MRPAPHPSSRVSLVSFFMLPYVSSLLCVADHCAIYILIAGSYTPFMLISMHGSSLGRTVIIAQWLCALFGCLFSITRSARNTLHLRQMYKSTLYIFLWVAFSSFPVRSAQQHIPVTAQHVQTFPFA